MASNSGNTKKRHHPNDMVNGAIEHYAETVEQRGDMSQEAKERAVADYERRMNDIWEHPDRPSNRK